MGFGAASSSPIVHVPRKAARGREASAAPGGVGLTAMVVAASSAIPIPSPLTPMSFETALARYTAAHTTKMTNAMDRQQKKMATMKTTTTWMKGTHMSTTTTTTGKAIDNDDAYNNEGAHMSMTTTTTGKAIDNDDAYNKEGAHMSMTTTTTGKAIDNEGSDDVRGVPSRGEGRGGASSASSAVSLSRDGNLAIKGTNVNTTTNQNTNQYTNIIVHSDSIQEICPPIHFECAEEYDQGLLSVSRKSVQLADTFDSSMHIHM